MATDRLTLFDIIADLIPGVLFLVLLIPIIPPQYKTALGSGVLGAAIILLAIGYAVGRVLHAVAARPFLTNLMTWIAWKFGLGWGIGHFVGSDQLKNLRDSGEERTNFAFPDRIESVNSMDHDSSAYEHVIIKKLLKRARSRIDFVDELGGPDTERQKWESDAKYLEHVGHSLLHSKSTIYQRYTILATFYRNLWVAISLGGLVLLTFYFAQMGTTDSVNSALLLGEILLAIFIILLVSVRWLEFRYRRLRALINDMYLTLERQPEESKEDDDGIPS